MKYEQYIAIGMMVLMLLGVFSSTIGWVGTWVIRGFDLFWKLIFRF